MPPPPPPTGWIAQKWTAPPPPPPPPHWFNRLKAESPPPPRSHIRLSNGSPVPYPAPPPPPLSHSAVKWLPPALSWPPPSPFQKCWGCPCVWPSTLVKHIQVIPSATVTDPGCPRPPVAHDNLLECPICLEILSQPIELPCSFLACAEYVIEWLKVSGTVLCPCCH